MRLFLNGNIHYGIVMMLKSLIQHCWKRHAQEFGTLKNISIIDSIIEAPKTFRRAQNIYLENVDLPIAQETLWNCMDIVLKAARVHGDYFGFNSINIKIDDLNLTGNYSFDGGRNIEVHNSKLISKDAFWNCENVTVYDSTIIGEYLGWNSKNITFIIVRLRVYKDFVILKI